MRFYLTGFGKGRFISQVPALVDFQPQNRLEDGADPGGQCRTVRQVQQQGRLGGLVE